MYDNHSQNSYNGPEQTFGGIMNETLSLHSIRRKVGQSREGVWAFRVRKTMMLIFNQKVGLATSRTDMS